MRRKLPLILVAAGLFANGTRPAAHHSFSAEFDADRPVKLKGSVVKMEWLNPHAWIHIDVKRSDGNVERWMIETGAPNALIRRGFNKNSLPIGTEIIVDAFQSRDGALRANGRDVTLSDGRVLFVGSSGTGAPYDDKGEGQR
jgi:hypothetical protein